MTSSSSPNNTNNSASSPSLARRSSKSSWMSISRTPSQSSRRPSRRASRRNSDANAWNSFDWNGMGMNSQDFGAGFGDLITTDVDMGFDFPSFPGDFNEPNGLNQSEFVNDQDFTALPAGCVSFNLYENPTVAVPGTPYVMTFPNANQPATPVFINGMWMVPADPQMAAVLSRGEHQTTMTDAKRTSVPKSLRFSTRRQPSKLRLQVPSQSDFDANDWMGQDYFETLNHSLLNASFTEPVPETVRPYSQSSSCGDSYRVSSPGGALGKRPRSAPSEPEDDELASKRFRNSPALSGRSVASGSTYVTRNTSGSASTRDSPGRSIKRRPGRRPLDKRTSMYNSDLNNQYQKPKLNPRNPEVRINRTTKGETTRTAKINEYNPCEYYTYSEGNIGNWRSARYKHDYADASLIDENTDEKVLIHELADRAMPADKIRDYILSYTRDGRGKLTLRIQVGGADSGGRYRQSSSKCRFADCPSRRCGLNGTIKHGHYRVAFDERSDDRYDPFAACTGFAHLYCMERFLDFEYICRKANVQVDRRSYLQYEPNGKFSAALCGRHNQAADLADDFIQYAQNDTDSKRRRGDKLGVRRLPEFTDYPVHEQYPEGDEKPYDQTLSYHMFRLTESTRPPAQKSQFATHGKKGRLGPSVITVHRGDLGMIADEHIRDKRLKKLNKKRESKGQAPLEDDYNSDSDFCIKVRAQIARAERDLAQSSVNSKPRTKQLQPQKPRQTIREEAGEEISDDEEEPVGNQCDPWDVSDDESDDDDFERRQPSNTQGTARRSNRIKNAPTQPNYQQQNCDHLGLDFDLPQTPARQRSISPPPRGYQRAFSFRPSVALDYPPADPESPTPPGRFRSASWLRSALPTRTPYINKHQSPFTAINKRHASFNVEPVTREKTFNSGAPPQNMRSRMVKELQNDSGYQPSSKKNDTSTTRRQTRSGRSFDSPLSKGFHQTDAMR